MGAYNATPYFWVYPLAGVEPKLVRAPYSEYLQLRAPYCAFIATRCVATYPYCYYVEMIPGATVDWAQDCPYLRIVRSIFLLPRGGSSPFRIATPARGIPAIPPFGNSSCHIEE